MEIQKQQADRAEGIGPVMTKEQLGQLSTLALAYIGDGVFELMVRCEMISRCGAPARDLHLQTVRQVCAEAQAEAIRRIAPLLDEEEQAVYRRGRNAKPGTIPKHARREDYAQATGLEALFGWLYLSGRRDRLIFLFHKAILPASEEVR